MAATRPTPSIRVARLGRTGLAIRRRLAALSSLGGEVSSGRPWRDQRTRIAGSRDRAIPSVGLQVGLCRAEGRRSAPEPRL